MTQYANSGALFKNRHRKSDNHPNARGCIDVTPEMAQRIAETGVIPISAWTKKGTRNDQNEPWQSLSIDESSFDYYVERRQKKATYSPSGQPATQHQSGPIDDIPF